MFIITDMLRWGQGPEDGMGVEVSVEEDSESLIDWFIMFMEEAEEELTIEDSTKKT